MPEEALLDTVQDEAVEAVDQSAGVDSQESGEQEGEQQQAIKDASAPVISDANGALKLSETARAQLDKIKAENPRLAREMRAALFDRQTLLSKVPGGVKEAISRLEEYEAEGGTEAVQAIKQENQLWKDLDADFQAGKREFVDDIAAGNPEAFVKIVPAAMAKFAEVAPELYSHEVSKVFAQDLAANDVMMTMKLLQREIAAIPEAQRGPVEELWKQLAGYVDRVNGMAKNAPKVESRVQAANPDIAQREQALTVQEFGIEKSRVKDSITSAEFTKNAAGRKIPGEKISTIQELYESALDRLVKSIPGHKGKVDRFLAAKDKAGYRKHMEAAIRSKAPEAMSQAFRRAGVGGKPGPVAKPAVKAVAGKSAAAVSTGFNRVGQKPNHNEIDWTRTARIPGKKGGDGKFIMRDGSKVLFQR
jgi:hypothetical protein